MKKLVLFGDSFANYDFYPELLDKTWGATLGKLLKLPVINYGISGSSLTYSLIKFTEYYQFDSYDPDDIIIFVLTDTSRVWTKSMKEHVGFGGIVHHMDRLKTLKGAPKKWFEENGQSALWAVFNIYDPEINYELIKMLSFLQTWATNSNNTLIAIRAFPKDDSSKATIAIENLTSMIKPSDNFFPIINTVPLARVSNFEIHKDCKRGGWWGHPDPRINHLSPINREILSLMLFDLISHKDISKYDSSLFKKDLYYEIPNWNVNGPLPASVYI